MENNEILVKVEGLSKKFCKDLKTSLWYGVKDLVSGLRGNKLDRELRDKEFWALKDINFELRRGECLGLIGHNGAGKSTLLKILNGLINPDAGKVTIKGRVGALIELGAGFNPILSGRENIYNNGAILSLSRNEIDTKLETIIAFAELEEFIDMPVQNYSSGMKVRLGFAVAAQMEPDVLIIDEVLAVGDLGFRLKCFKRIDQILPKTAIIFVSHSMPMVSRICNNIMLLDHGVSKFGGIDVSKAIDLYYGYFENNESNIIFTDNTVELINVELLEVVNYLNSLPQINWGQDFKLKLKFNLKRPIDIIMFSVSVFDSEQRPVALFTPNKEKLSIIEENNEIEFVLTHAKIQLSKGIYSLNLWVGHIKTTNPFLRINNVLQFQILNEKDVWPSFLLESTFS